MRVSKFYFTLLLFVLCWNLIFCMLTRNKGHKQPKQLRRSERSKAHVNCSYLYFFLKSFKNKRM